MTTNNRRRRVTMLSSLLVSFEFSYPILQAPIHRSSWRNCLINQDWPQMVAAGLQNGAKKPCLAMLGPRDARSRRPSAIYQTVSLRTWVNMGVDIGVNIAVSNAP